MGVEGLLSVAQSFREEFTYSVVNPDLNDDFNYKYFVFDGSSWLWNTMKGNILMDFAYIRRRAKSMVNKFRLCGFKLIVFIDANITNNKLDTWLSRRAQRVENLYSINHKIKSNRGNIQGFNQIWFAPCGAYFFCGQIFESLGCKVMYAHIDCDREMYGYYLLNKTYFTINGVIGFDTDFLIFNFPIYLELISMRFNKESNTMSFNGYQHERILNRLRCKQRHLSRVASIMGCDVTNRLQTCSGNIDYAVKIVKETEITIKNKEEKNNKDKIGTLKKKKAHRSYFGESHGGLKKRYNLAETFYSGIIPLDILNHPWLIMLLFQDYNERIDECVVKTDKENKLNKNGSPYYYIKGLIMDLSMDDADLIKNHFESSSIITLELRKWIYRYLLNDLKTDWNNNNNSDDRNDHFQQLLNKKDLRMKELICYAAPRLCFKEDMTKREWLKGISVAVFEEEENDDHINPLFNLESYKFIKSVIEMEKDDDKSNNDDDDEDEDEDESEDDILMVEVPEEYMVRDIIYLLNYLRDLDKKKNNEMNENVENDDNDDKMDENKENNNDDDVVEDIKCEQQDNEQQENNNNNNNKDELIPFVFGVVNPEPIKTSELLITDQIETNNEDNDDNNDKIKEKESNKEEEQWSTKKTNNAKKRTKKRGKRGRAGKKRKQNKKKKKDIEKNSVNIECNKESKTEINGLKKQEKKIKKKTNKNGLKTWDGFTMFVNAFLWQWKYRDIFIKCDDPKSEKNKHIEFESHYLKINSRSMHYRSILYSIYEIIYVFLQIQFKSKWFPKYYCEFLRYHYNSNRNRNNKNNNNKKKNNKDNDKKQEECFINIPKLQLLNGIDCKLRSIFNEEDCQCINCTKREYIDLWKDNITNNNKIEMELQIPYVWKILNTRIFHWIWAHHTKTKQWINECRTDAL